MDKVTEVLRIIAEFGGPVALTLLQQFAPAALPIAHLILSGVDKGVSFLQADKQAQQLDTTQLKRLLDKDEAALLDNLSKDIATLEIKLAKEKAEAFERQHAAKVFNV